MTVAIVDTTVFCNLLGVQNRDQHHAQALDEFRNYVDDGYHLLLPLPTIYETGGHIAHQPDGRMRRDIAENFCRAVRDAFDGSAPWTPTPFPESSRMLEWLGEFPDYAVRETTKVDLSLIKIFEKQCALNRGRRVFIWSYDGDLDSYDREARI